MSDSPQWADGPGSNSSARLLVSAWPGMELIHAREAVTLKKDETKAFRSPARKGGDFF
jgi:hypothetical protein